MLFYEIAPPTTPISEISAMLRMNCDQFIEESQGLPLYKSLPSVYGSFKRVKVRFQKRKNLTSEVYEAAFGNGAGTFREKCVTAYGTSPNQSDPNLSEYYVFPINGFKFMYSKQVMDSTTAFEGVVNTLIDNLPLSEGAAIATDLLKYSYQQENLVEGIRSGAEIIIHSVSNYYVVNAALYPNYKLLTV